MISRRSVTKKRRWFLMSIEGFDPEEENRKEMKRWEKGMPQSMLWSGYLYVAIKTKKKCHLCLKCYDWWKAPLIVSQKFQLLLKTKPKTLPTVIKTGHTLPPPISRYLSHPQWTLQVSMKSNWPVQCYKQPRICSNVDFASTSVKSANPLRQWFQSFLVAPITNSVL